MRSANVINFYLYRKNFSLETGLELGNKLLLNACLYAYQLQKEK